MGELVVAGVPTQAHATISQCPTAAVMLPELVTTVWSTTCGQAVLSRETPARPHHQQCGWRLRHQFATSRWVEACNALGRH
jgi:hypothetical protein